MGLKRANNPDEPEVLSIENLTRLSDPGFEVVADDRGDYPYGTVQLTDQLTATDGYIARKGAGNSALATIEALVASIIVGHTHRLAVTHHTRWTADDQPRIDTAAETGTKGNLSGLGYTRHADWQSGWLTAHLRSDGSHHIDLAPFRDGTLRWRDCQWRLTARGIRVT